MPLYRKLLGVSAAAALTASATGARKKARRRAIELGAPFGVLPTLPTGEAQRVGVVYNPSKPGVAAAIEILERTLAANGHPQALVRTTRVDEPGSEAARELIAEGVDLLIAAGGDGTVRAVAAALAHHEGPKPRLGILPMGTGNLLARNLYIPVSDVAACVNIALNGVGQDVDAIEMTTTGTTGEETEHTFFVMSGAGFDALVMNDTNEEIKAKFGWVAYVQSGMKHMLGRSHPVRISVDGGEPRILPMRSVLIANCGRLQGGIRLADMTDVHDGKLEVIVASPRDLMEWGLLMAKVMRRTILGSPRIELPVIRHLVGSEVVLEFPDGAQPVEVDGDPAPSAHRISARVLPAAVDMRSVLIANCGRLQGGIRLADMTDVHDGKLEVIVASPRDLMEWGLLMAKVMRRTILGSPRIELPVIRHLVGSEVVLEFPDGAQPVEVDGDPAPSAHRISARVLPAAVEVAVHPDVL